MEPITYAWLAVGLVPHQIQKRYPSRNVRTIAIRALFWTLEIRTMRMPVTVRHPARKSLLHPAPVAYGARRYRCRTAWTLCVPLIERVRDAVWAAVMRLKG